MTALAQGSAGVALVMCFVMLGTGQVRAAAVLLAVQSGAVAMAAVVLHQPLMAVPPLMLGAGFWLLQRKTPMFQSRTMPTGGAKLGICAGAVLAVLSQSQDGIGLPTAIVLLSVLLAATRSHPLMQVLALVAAQNGIALAYCLVAGPALPAGPLVAAPLVAGAWLPGAWLPGAWLPRLGVAGTLHGALILPIACLALPLPLAGGLLVPAIASSPGPDVANVTFEGGLPARAWWLPSLPWVLPAAFSRWKFFGSAVYRKALPAATGSLGWVDCGLAVGILVATLITPLDALASTFAPLLGLDGVLRSWVRRDRTAQGLIRRGSALVQTGCTVLAVCSANLMVAWLAVLVAMAMALAPTMSRRWSSAVLAFLAAGLSLFGMVLLPTGPSVLAYFSLFVGFVAVSAVVPDLAIVLVILILRLANRSTWPFAVEALGIGIAAAGLLACAILLANPSRSHRTTLLLLSQTSIAALTVCIGQADARLAALVLLVLLILTRAAARSTVGVAGTLAIAGLGGSSPLGVLPGLVLVVLTLSAHDPWLLLPVGMALILMVLASVPSRLPKFSPATIVSVAWLPLLLAAGVGYLAPSGLVHWWRILTAGGT